MHTTSIKNCRAEFCVLYVSLFDASGRHDDVYVFVALSVSVNVSAYVLLSVSMLPSMSLLVPLAWIFFLSVSLPLCLYFCECSCVRLPISMRLWCRDPSIHPVDMSVRPCVFVSLCVFVYL